MELNQSCPYLNVNKSSDSMVVSSYATEYPSENWKSLSPGYPVLTSVYNKIKENNWVENSRSSKEFVIAVKPTLTQEGHKRQHKTKPKVRFSGGQGTG